MPHNDSSKTMRFQNAVWPESLPNAAEEHIFTLLCGNSHVNWSLHMGARHKFSAKLHWRYVNMCMYQLSFVGCCVVLMELCRNEFEHCASMRSCVCVSA
jgi:hypothetical protein